MITLKQLGRVTLAFMIAYLLTGIILIAVCKAEIDDETAVNCIIGEAANQGELGMYAVASGLLNRGTIKGVYGCRAKHVFKEPKYVWDMAKQALFRAKVQRLHPGTHWEAIQTFGTPYWGAIVEPLP